MASKQRLQLEDNDRVLYALLNNMLIKEAVEKLDTAAKQEMKLHGVSVLWSKITRAKGILHEALALENQPS